MEYTIIALKLLGTLGLLIFAMQMMSGALQKMAGSQLRHTLGRITNNRFIGMLTGAFVTCAVQSSSATTVMTVSFVSAGLLTLGQAISVIMGANIGTTLTAWIMSLGYNVDLTMAVFPAFLIGIILIYTKKHRYLGEFLFGIAFMFFSLVILSNTGKELDLEHNPFVAQFFSGFDTDKYSSILIFLLSGTIITCIVQSSAAVMAITIMLCSSGVLPIYLGIALVLGENIGTTATANLAALGAGIQARRAALSHLLFNLFGVVWILCFFYPFVDLVCKLTGYNPSLPNQTALLPIVLATFHTCFNITNTLILIWFVPQIEKIVCKILPEKNDEQLQQLRYIEGSIIQTPEISVFEAQKETIKYAQSTQQLFGKVKTLLDQKDDDGFLKTYNEIVDGEDISDKTEIYIARYLEQVSDNHLSVETKVKVRKMLREISEIESIGDSCFNMARILKRRKESGKEFSTACYSKICSIMTLVDNALSQMNNVLADYTKKHNIRDTYRIENEIDQTRKRLKTENIQSVDNREYDYATGTLFADLVNECEKLGDYVVNVVQARLGK